MSGRPADAAAGRAWPDDGPDRDELAGFADELADAARAVVLRYFRTGVEVGYKADDSPVTVADREAEQALSALIRQRFPEHSVRGEELGRSGPSGARWGWVLDPIDGTRSFVTGRPLFGTLIAFLDGERPILGVIDLPALGERYAGTAGGPAHCNARPCRTSGCARLADARVSATSPDLFDPGERTAFDAVSAGARFRTFGGDCHQYALLAAGHLDLVMEAALAPHDFLALAPLVAGAGGVVTDWDGAPLTARSGGRVLAAATPELHRAALRTVRDAR